MPHVVVEYSANLRQRVDVPRLLRTVHDAALATGIFPLGGIRTRAEERTDCVVADGHSDNVSVHVTLRVGHGRNLDARRQVDQRVVEFWRQGDWKTFIRMLPAYAERCVGEGGMHDTAMRLGLLGWTAYDRPVEIVTPYFPSSGTGQINARFPL
jgi:5-carboxymethyl-2-hydroxymuconate isomerase